MDNFEKKDVFISYRRSDGSHAHLLYKNLVGLHYSVFFDIKSMRSGKFPEQIETAINNCKDFILVVTPNLFSERIFNDDDWVRKEIKIALSSTNVKILVLFIGEVKFPSELPEDINAIRYCQSVKQNNMEMVDELHKRICEHYLQSKPHLDMDVKQFRTSIYDAAIFNEEDRLRVQAKNSRNFDLRILNQLELNNEGLSVLDVGCGYGFVTEDRFSDPKYKNIFGVDVNEVVINKARNRIKDDRFEFFVANVEDEGFIDQLKNKMNEKGIKGFDIIFASYVMHHLGNPPKAVRKLRDLLNPGGYIFLRCSDDGMKASYGDNGLVDAIIKKTMEAEGVSDRLNGRKSFFWLQQAHLRDIQIYTDGVNTASMSYEEKIDLFLESFSYRSNYFKKAYAKYGTEEALENLNYMESKILELEDLFYSPSFWYMEVVFIAVGRK